MNNANGHYSKEYNAKYRRDPNAWVADALKGVHLWSLQREILDSVFKNRKTVVRASHGVGKTFTAAVAVLAFLYTQVPSKVITTAPTWKQVKDLLWREIGHLFKTHLSPAGFPGDPLQTTLNIHDDWFATGISPKDEVNMQGYHQSNILVIADECPGVRPDIITGLDTLMSTMNAHQLWIGNPTQAQGHFYNAFHDPSVVKFKMSAFESPNFTGEDVPPEVKRKLVSKAWVEDMRKQWGEDSPLWASKVMGEFPKSSENQLIDLVSCQEAIAREIVHRDDEETIIGLDVARYGIDSTVFSVTTGFELTDLIEMVQQSTMETSGQAVVLFETFNATKIRVDEIGIGAGVVDRLEELGLPVFGVNSASKAQFQPDRYFNLRTELWFNMANWLAIGKIPDNDLLIADLVTPVHKFRSDGRYMLEPKEDIIKRLGRSCDYGDSAVLSTPKYVMIEAEVPRPPPKARSTFRTSEELLEQAGLL